MLFAVGIVSACAIAGLYLLARIVMLLGEINRKLGAIELDRQK
ncbi:MAG TPA: hypothetical protein VFB37_06870 [Steroidobacteraceae bacterium]|nr:hypothetical protein [Steroidobacteraceae bacterium]